MTSSLQSEFFKHFFYIFQLAILDSQQTQTMKFATECWLSVTLFRRLLMIATTTMEGQNCSYLKTMPKSSGFWQSSNLVKVHKFATTSTQLPMESILLVRKYTDCKQG